MTLFGAKTNNELSDSEIENIDYQLLKMIAKDFQPLSVVENEGFLGYSRALNPLYKPPTRQRLSFVILPTYYSKSASALKLILNNIKNKAVTTDIWTSDSNRGYITLTCHYIFEEKMCAHVFATNEISGSHTGENIGEAVRTILDEWDIKDKIVTVVSDNGANVKKAITEFLQKHHHPCVAHTLNLSVNEAISSNDNLNIILRKCRALVGHFKHSVVANDKLRTIQQQMGLLILKVKQDVVRR